MESQGGYWGNVSNIWCNCVCWGVGFKDITNFHGCLGRIFAYMPVTLFPLWIPDECVTWNVCACVYMQGFLPLLLCFTEPQYDSCACWCEMIPSQTLYSPWKWTDLCIILILGFDTGWVYFSCYCCCCHKLQYTFLDPFLFSWSNSCLPLVLYTKIRIKIKCCRQKYIPFSRDTIFP